MKNQKLKFLVSTLEDYQLDPESEEAIKMKKLLDQLTLKMETAFLSAKEIKKLNA